MVVLLEFNGDRHAHRIDIRNDPPAHYLCSLNPNDVSAPAMDARLASLPEGASCAYSTIIPHGGLETVVSGRISELAAYSILTVPESKAQEMPSTYLPIPDKMRIAMHFFPIAGDALEHPLVFYEDGPVDAMIDAFERNVLTKSGEVRRRYPPHAFREGCRANLQAVLELALPGYPQTCTGVTSDLAVYACLEIPSPNVQFSIVPAGIYRFEIASPAPRG